MKKILLAFAATILSLNIFAQCTPDVTITSYIAPNPLPDATVGQAYNVTVSFKVPKDSTYLGYAVTIDSTRVYKLGYVVVGTTDTIPGVPPGFTWQCNNAYCMWNGGQFGCAKLSGFADSSLYDKYEVWVYVAINLHLTSAPSSPIQVLQSSEIDLKVIGGRKAGIDDIGKPYALKMFPNPAKSIVSFDMSDIKNQPAMLEIRDIAGKLVLGKQIAHAANTEEIDVSAIKQGIYLVVVKSENRTGQSRLVIEK